MTPADQIALLRDALKNAAKVIDRMSYCPDRCDCYPCSTRDSANAALAATAAPEQPKSQLTQGEAKQIRDLALVAAPQQERDTQDAAAIADRVRLRLAQEYQRRIDNDTARMGGNMDWARLEGAVEVVQALRRTVIAAAPKGETK